MKNNTEMDVMENQYMGSRYEKEKFIVSERENIQTDLIKITRDKLEIILLKEFNSMKKVSDWKTPASIFITSLITVLTATFKDFLLPKEIWNAIFLLLMLSSGICFLINLVRLLKTHKKDSIGSLINKIANIEEDCG